MAGCTVRQMSDPWAPTAAGTRTKPRKRSRKVLIAICVVAAAVGLTGMAAGVYAFTRDTSIVDQLAGKMTVKGTITLDLESMLNWGTACSGRKPLDDVKIGAPVEITDADGKTIGLGQVETAKEADTRCVMTFKVKDVPNDSGFYSVLVAGHNAGKFTADEMAKPIALTVS